MRFSKFNITAPDMPGQGSSAVYNTLTQGLAVLEDRIVEGLKKGVADGLGPEEIKSLEEMGVLVPDGVDEDRLLDLFYNQIRFSGRTLGITLLTTMNCNFACSYCYEGELKRGRKFMSLETADAVIAWIKARAKESRVSTIDIQYHGGEPLLNIPVIEKVGSEITEFCREKKIRLTSHIVSNGYLLDRKTAERIKAVGVTSVRVGVDGPEDVHNSTRILRGGGGTYRTIMDNLHEIKDVLKMSIGLNYTNETAKRVPEFLDTLIKEGLGPETIKRVECYPVMPGEGSAALDAGCIPSDDLYTEMLPVREEAEKRGFWKHADPEISPCPVVVPTHFTINYDGDICKCPALADRPEYRVGNVRDEMVYNAEMYRCLAHNTFDNEKCRNCAVLPLCLGGCRYLALVKTGNFHDIDCRKEGIEAFVMDAIRRATSGEQP